MVSPTKGTEYRVEVSRRVLGAGHRVLIVDDFLSGGRTAEALGEIAEEAACTVVGFGFAIEKSFQRGRERLANHGWRVRSCRIFCRCLRPRMIPFHIENRPKSPSEDPAHECDDD